MAATMTDSIHIREASRSDFAELMRLYRQLHPQDPELTDGKDRKVFDEILGSPLLHLFVAEQTDPHEPRPHLLASCYLNLIPNITRSASPYAIIENVITDESRRAQGIGKRLIQHVLMVAWSHGCYKAMLQTGSKTPATHAFYRACGFSADDKTGYVARP